MSGNGTGKQRLDLKHYSITMLKRDAALKPQHFDGEELRMYRPSPFSSRYLDLGPRGFWAGAAPDRGGGDHLPR